MTYKPNINSHPSKVFSMVTSHPSKVFSMIGYDITITNTLNLTKQTTPEQPLQFQEMTLLVIYSTIKWFSLQCSRWCTWKNWSHAQSKSLFTGHLHPPYPQGKQFKPNRPNAKAMYEHATTLPATLAFSSKQINMETTSSRTSTKSTKILRTQPFRSNTFKNNNPTTWFR